MDKHCKGCSYQVFEDTDKYHSAGKNWGFCGYKGIIEECKSKMDPDIGLQIMDCLEKESEVISIVGLVPSCQFVQTCFDGKCPCYRNGNIKGMN